MKKEYLKPEFDYTKFEIDDVITASGLAMDSESDEPNFGQIK